MKTNDKQRSTPHEPHIAKQVKAGTLSEGEESLRQKCCPRVKIPNFKSRDILRRLEAPNRRSIWPNFSQNSLVRHEDDITSVGKCQPT